MAARPRCSKPADQIGTIAAAQDGAANQLATVIDQLSASPDPAAVNAVGALRGVQDQLRGHQFTPQIRQQLTNAQNATGPLRSSARPSGPRGQDLTSKLTQLRSGAEQLAAGSAELSTGIGKLDDGATQLKTGSAQLRAGSAELAAKLGRRRKAAAQLDHSATERHRRHHRRPGPTRHHT